MEAENSPCTQQRGQFNKLASPGLSALQDRSFWWRVGITVSYGPCGDTDGRATTHSNSKGGLALGCGPRAPRETAWLLGLRLLARTSPTCGSVRAPCSLPGEARASGPGVGHPAPQPRACPAAPPRRWLRVARVSRATAAPSSQGTRPRRPRCPPSKGPPGGLAHPFQEAASCLCMLLWLMPDTLSPACWG